MHTVYLALGSNEGDRMVWLNKGIMDIANLVGPITQRSSVYETAAWGKNDQPAFLNMVVRVDTALTASQVLAATQQIENESGRQRTVKWGARTLDIDILFYDDQISNDVALVLPHPFLHLRRFTLEPLNEIAPDWQHPALHKSIATLLADCPDRLEVVRVG